MALALQQPLPNRKATVETALEQTQTHEQSAYTGQVPVAQWTPLSPGHRSRVTARHRNRAMATTIAEQLCVCLVRRTLSPPQSPVCRVTVWSHVLLYHRFKISILPVAGTVMPLTHDRHWVAAS